VESEKEEASTIDLSSAIQAAAEAVILGEIEGGFRTIVPRHKWEVVDAIKQTIRKHVSDDIDTELSLELYGILYFTDLLLHDDEEIDKHLHHAPDIAAIITQTRDRILEGDPARSSHDRIQDALPVTLLDPKDPEGEPRLRLIHQWEKTA
jgi:hypothetical protein